MLRVKEICKERGITMTELTERLGISLSALTQTINGNPTIGKVKEIAKALDVDYLELLEEKTDIKILVEYQGETKRITENDIIKIFKGK